LTTPFPLHLSHSFISSGFELPVPLQTLQHLFLVIFNFLVFPLYNSSKVDGIALCIGSPLTGPDFCFFLPPL